LEGGHHMTSADVIWRLLERIEKLEKELDSLVKVDEQKEAKD